MISRLIRRIAILLLMGYAFAQASVALAACGMDRSAMATAMAMPAGDDCGGCDTPADSVAASCVAHCTADLQLSSGGTFFIAEAAWVLRALPEPRVRSAPPISAYPPPGPPPRRILLHSFQI